MALRGGGRALVLGNFNNSSTAIHGVTASPSQPTGGPRHEPCASADAWRRGGSEAGMPRVPMLLLRTYRTLVCTWGRIVCVVHHASSSSGGRSVVGPSIPLVPCPVPVVTSEARAHWSPDAAAARCSQLTVVAEDYINALNMEYGFSAGVLMHRTSKTRNPLRFPHFRNILEKIVSHTQQSCTRSKSTLG